MALGTLLALAASRLLSGSLYGVEPADPAVFGGVAAVLTLVGVAASWVPARRAAALDPVEALRAE